jgi:iron complex outermembrane receptor protein
MLRSNLSFHLEHNVLLQRFTLSAGLVAVKNTWNGMPFKVYPGIDASYRIGNDWKVYVSYNSSLRMPSFTELYYSVGGHKADKYLKPEELQAAEGGVKYLTSAVTAQASVYYHHLRNMIDWVMDPTAVHPVWTSVNHTKVNTLGFESSVRLNLQQLLGWQQSSFDIAYCYNDQRKRDLGQLTQSKLEYLRHKFVAQLQAHLVGCLDLGVKYRLQKRTGSYTTTDGVVEPYHTYDVVDARLTWNADLYSVYTEVNNLFSRRYIDYGNVPQPGAWFVVGAKITIM